MAVESKRPRPLPIFAALALLLTATGCSSDTSSPYPLPHSPPEGQEVMVMSYNLRLYAYMDRDDDGQDDDFKPEDEIAGIVATISAVKPDVLAIQEIGRRKALDDLLERLTEAGADYPYIDYLDNDQSFARLAILSRLPIAASEPVTNLSYTIQGETFPVRRGFQRVDIETGPGESFTLFNAHLKSKRFHPSGQTEMRRNEARLLATHIRRLVDADPERRIVVCGDLNDSIRSAAMRELVDQEEGSVLTDLFLRDRNGHIWTHFYGWHQEYSRIDYILVSRNATQHVVKSKSGVAQMPDLLEASDHRPVYATFSW